MFIGHTAVTLISLYTHLRMGKDSQSLSISPTKFTQHRCTTAAVLLSQLGIRNEKCVQTRLGPPQTNIRHNLAHVCSGMWFANKENRDTDR